jgi:hypothetical protein
MQKPKMNIPLGGISKEVLIDDVPLDQIDFDPGNPRLGYWKDLQNNSIENISQKEVASALVFEDDEGIRQLKLNIEVNNGIINPIWVIRKGKRYLAIDGNTRLHIYKDLSKKYPEKDVFKKIKCKILPEDTEEKVIESIRLNEHLRGVNDWEVYVRAKMLYILSDKRGYPLEELQSKTKLSQNQISRWIEAYKNMSEQFMPKYGDQPDAHRKFSYFIEYEKPIIKNGMAELGLSINDFCDWVGKGEIRKAQDVRDLTKILRDKVASAALVKKGYEYALEQLSSSDPSIRSELFENIENVIEGLRNMPRSEEQEIVEEKNSTRKELLRTLHIELQKLVKHFN